MTETAKLKRRIKQLEKCLGEVREYSLTIEEEWERQHSDRAREESGEYALARQITNRINRTL